MRPRPRWANSWAPARWDRAGQGGNRRASAGNPFGAADMLPAGPVPLGTQATYVAGGRPGGGLGGSPGCLPAREGRRNVLHRLHPALLFLPFVLTLAACAPPPASTG